MLKKFKLSFDAWGLILFLIIMIPNFIWFAVPAPNDILRSDSITGTLDTVASLFQVLMIVALCILKNRECNKICVNPFVILISSCCLLYFFSWIAYYNSIVNAIVILGLTIFPCLAFLFFSIDRKNWIALIPASLFTICHLIYAIANFII